MCIRDSFTTIPTSLLPAPTGDAGATTCTDCAAGKSSSVSTTGCANCALGKHQDAGRQTSCKDCGTGKYADEYGLPNCKSCDSGTYNDETGSTAAKSISCKECAKGQFSGTSAQASCTDCGTGRYADQTGTGTCKTCGIGKYNEETGSQSSSKCKNCEPGKFQDAEGQATCKNCPASKYQNVAGQGNCKFCPGGKYSPTNSDHTAHDALADCIDCAPGTQRSNFYNSDHCAACPAGQYANAASTTCINCEQGKYNDETTQTTCKACDRGKYNEETQSSEASDCKICAHGAYNDETGKASCKDCESGSYSPQGAVAAAITPILQTTGTPDVTTNQIGNIDAATCEAYAISSGKTWLGVGQGGKYHRYVYSCNSDGKFRNYGCSGLGLTSSCASCSAGNGIPVNPESMFWESPHSIYNWWVCGCFHQSDSDSIGWNNCVGGVSPPCVHSKSSIPRAKEWQGQYGGSMQYINFPQPPSTHYSDACVVAEPSCVACFGRTYVSATKDFCQECPSGYGEKTNAGHTSLHNTCEKCPAGKYQTTTSDSCVVCEIGKYQNEKGQTSCKNCGVTSGIHSYQDETGKSSCKYCGNGKQTVSSTLGCEDCAIGRYSNSNQQCIDCENAKYADQTGRSSCYNCDAGYGSLPASTAESACTLCPHGQSVTISGQSTCTACPADTYNLPILNDIMGVSLNNAENLGLARSVCSACPEYNNWLVRAPDFDYANRAVKNRQITYDTTDVYNMNTEDYLCAHDTLLPTTSSPYFMLDKTRSENEIPDGLVDFSATGIKVNDKHYILVHGGRVGNTVYGQSWFYSVEENRFVTRGSHASSNPSVYSTDEYTAYEWSSRYIENGHTVQSDLGPRYGHSVAYMPQFNLYVLVGGRTATKWYSMRQVLIGQPTCSGSGDSISCNMKLKHCLKTSWREECTYYHNNLVVSDLTNYYGQSGPSTPAKRAYPALTASSTQENMFNLNYMNIWSTYYDGRPSCQNPDVSGDYLYMYGGLGESGVWLDDVWVFRVVCHKQYTSWGNQPNYWEYSTTQYWVRLSSGTGYNIDHPSSRSITVQNLFQVANANKMMSYNYVTNTYDLQNLPNPYDDRDPSKAFVTFQWDFLSLFRSNFDYGEDDGADNTFRVISWIEFFLGPTNARITELIDTDMATNDWYTAPILMPRIMDFYNEDFDELTEGQSVIEQTRSSTLVGDIAMFVISMAFDFVTIPVGTAFEDGVGLLGEFEADCWNVVARTGGPWDGNWLEYRYDTAYANGFPLNLLKANQNFYSGYDDTYRIYGSCVVVPYRTPMVYQNGAWNTNDNWQTVQGYIYVHNPHSTAEDKPCGVYKNGVYDNSADGFNNKQLKGMVCFTCQKRHAITIEPKMWTNKVNYYVD